MFFSLHRNFECLFNIQLWMLLRVSNVCMSDCVDLHTLVFPIILCVCCWLWRCWLSLSGCDARVAMWLCFGFVVVWCFVLWWVVGCVIWCAIVLVVMCDYDAFWFWLRYYGLCAMSVRVGDSCYDCDNCNAACWHSMFVGWLWLWWFVCGLWCCDLLWCTLVLCVSVWCLAVRTWLLCAFLMLVWFLLWTHLKFKCAWPFFYNLNINIHLFNKHRNISVDRRCTLLPAAAVAQSGTLSSAQAHCRPRNKTSHTYVLPYTPTR